MYEIYCESFSLMLKHIRKSEEVTFSNLDIFLKILANTASEKLAQ
jgi:hypothetical protein